jgi:hypothetical protein
VSCVAISLATGALAVASAVLDAAQRPELLVCLEAMLIDWATIVLNYGTPRTHGFPVSWIARLDSIAPLQAPSEQIGLGRILAESPIRSYLRFDVHSDACKVGWAPGSERRSR